ncbi:caspase-12-like isoform X1 [Aotus nancymaae]|uniref:caspase-12-like isoform X1 n=1 Tax=Aotus nancymaae TaxID=37293 RepID=UPI0030FE845F
MAGKKPSIENLLNMTKMLTGKFLSGISDELMENSPLDAEESWILVVGVNFILKNAGNLLDNNTETAKVTDKIFRDHLLNPQNQLSLESEEENEESRDEERPASAQSMAVFPKDNVSWRHEANDSIFISKIIHYFKEYSWSHHLEEIFRKVQHSFERPNVLTQLPTIERVSMTYFYLFPGN